MRYALLILSSFLMAACAAPQPGPTPAATPETSPSPTPRPDVNPHREPEPQFPGGVPWGSSVDEAKAVALKQGKRLFIEFTGHGCIPCAKLEKKVWPSAELAARIHRDYVAVQIWDDGDRDAGRDYDIQVIPSLIVAEADGTLLIKQVGPPFMSPNAAITWFDDIPARLKVVADAEAAAKNRPEDFFAQLDLYRARQTVGRTDSADLALTAAEKLAGEDAGRKLEIDIARLCVLSARQKLSAAKEIAERVAKALVEKNDPRLPELGLVIVDVYAFCNKYTEARELAFKVNTVAPKNPDVLQYKVRAAYAAFRAGDKATAKTELDAIIAAGPEDDLWVSTAKEIRDNAFKSSNSGG